MPALELAFLIAGFALFVYEIPGLKTLPEISENSNPAQASYHDSLSFTTAIFCGTQENEYPEVPFQSRRFLISASNWPSSLVKRAASAPLMAL